MADWKVAPVQLVTTALLAMLKAELEPGWKVYDTNVPPSAASSYYMLSQIGGGSFSGPPLTAPEIDEEIVYQLDAVAARRDQAQLMADRGKELMVGRDATGALRFALTMPGGWVESGRIRNDVPGGVDQEGAPPSVVYTAPNRYTVQVTPS